MRKQFMTVAAVVLALSLTACGSEATTSESSGAQQETSSQSSSSASLSADSAQSGTSAETTETSTVSTSAASAEDNTDSATDDSDFSQVLVDDENVYVEITSIEHDSIWGYTWKMNLKNHTDQTLMYSMENVSVNGIMSDPFWAEEVAPGKEANSDVSWSTTDFEDNDIEQVTEVSFTLHVYDSETYETDYVNQEFTVYPLGEDAVQNNTREADENDVTLFENDQFAMRVTGVEPEGEWGYTLDVTLVNNTDQAVYFSVENASINGIMCDPFWADEVAAGKSANDEISWTDSSLSDAGLDASSITTIDLPVTVSSSEDIASGAMIDQTFTLTEEQLQSLGG
ncbi:MAG: hypothetical protein SOI56_02540 [Eubacteriales bacterium]|jgi:hypothetical protein